MFKNQQARPIQKDSVNFYESNAHLFSTQRPLITILGFQNFKFPWLHHQSLQTKPERSWPKICWTQEKIISKRQDETYTERLSEFPRVEWSPFQPSLTSNSDFGFSKFQVWMTPPWTTSDQTWVVMTKNMLDPRINNFKVTWRNLHRKTQWISTSRMVTFSTLKDL